MDNRDEVIDTIVKAMRTAWQLGQTYWRQADSDFTSDHRRSDETQRKYDMLVQETIAAISRSQDAPRCQCCGYLVTESEHRGCLRSAERSQDVARVAEGWMLVPTKSTPEMREAFKRAYQDGSIWTERIDYALEQFIEAAPQPPQAGANEHEKVMLDAILHGTGFMKDGKHVPREDVLAPAAPAEQPFGQWCREEGRRLLGKCTPGKMVEDDPAQAYPIAWVRFCSDGSIEGPIMDAYMEDVRKSSGAWTPLVARSEVRAPAPAEPKGEQQDDYEAKGTIEHLDLDNHRLRRAMQKIMARLAELLDEDQFANIESIVKGVGVEPPEQRAAPIGKVLSDAEMFDAKMDGKSGNVIWFNAPKPGFIYAAPAEQRAANKECNDD